jgi:antitoxin HicB
MSSKYSMTIRWSDEDRAYLVWLPEFGDGPQIHGDTYEAAALAGAELIESHLQWIEGAGKPAPTPQVYVDPDAQKSGASVGMSKVSA